MSYGRRPGPLVFVGPHVEPAHELAILLIHVDGTTPGSCPRADGAAPSGDKHRSRVAPLLELSSRTPGDKPIGGATRSAEATHSPASWNCQSVR